MEEKETLDEFHYHEAIDRSYLIAEMIETILLTHPVIQKHRDLKKRVANAQQLIYNVYQLIGGLELALFPPKE